MIIITGPTSSGKTSLAIKLAKELGFDLISADSRQIYKHMDIGTGKKPINADVAVTPHNKYWEIDGVKVYMYDVVSPDEEYSSVQFAEDARAIIEKNPKTIIVGGTGFYIDALATDQIDSNIPSNNEMREELAKKSLEELQAMIPGLEIWNNSEKNNPARLIRAITIFNESGKWPDKNKKPADPSENNLVIELTAPREFLYERVDKWADAIWESVLYEIKRLEKLGFAETIPANGIIYKTAKSFLNAEVTEEQALDRIKFDLHKYIRRQQTWFKKYKHSIKLDISKDSFDTRAKTLVKSYLYER